MALAFRMMLELRQTRSLPRSFDGAASFNWWPTIFRTADTSSAATNYFSRYLQAFLVNRRVNVQCCVQRDGVFAEIGVLVQQTGGLSDE